MVQRRIVAQRGIVVQRGTASVAELKLNTWDCNS